MNKDILNFNKEIALEVRKIIKKTQNFTKELILKSAKEKGLCLVSSLLIVEGLKF